MKKLITLTESELVRFIGEIIGEQTGPGITNMANSRGYEDDLEKKFPCVPRTVLLFVDFVMRHEKKLTTELGIDRNTLILLTKISVGILGRETKFGMSTEKKDFYAEIVKQLGLGKLLDSYLRKKFPSKTPSLGMGQFTKPNWDKYNLDKKVGDYNRSFNQVDQGLGILYSVFDRYNKAIKNGLTKNSSVNPILSKYGIINNINGTGNHALDMAILSHNMPENKILFPYCTTNHELYAAPCYKTKHKPFETPRSFNPNSKLLQRVKNPKLKEFPGELTVNRNDVIKNYFPNLSGPKHTAIGYLEEVVNYIKKLGCIK